MIYIYIEQINIQLQLKLFSFNKKNIHSTSTQTILLQHKYSHIISAIQHFSNVISWANH